MTKDCYGLRKPPYNYGPQTVVCIFFFFPLVNPHLRYLRGLGKGMGAYGKVKKQQMATKYEKMP